ncbi:MAG: hypothetical protein CVU91_08950 [Firmicutes bacterium HGW-Firmicutes-16]|nr:MAG: hypothetical protein CVU91_08950 [Firmicutes bacterium HGW-Firmicutes-16]
MEKRHRLFAAIAAALILLSGCSLTGVHELYSLPQAPKEYLQLQELIDDEIGAGSEYSAPTAGSLRQSIQLVDLDGDGTNEALAFLRNKDLQPEICVYRKTDENYALAATIFGDGTAIGRVECADINSDGVSEILVSWEVSAELRLLKVYSMKDWKSSVLMMASCADFQLGDLDSNEITDIIALNLEASGGMVDMYTIYKSGNVAQESARLSTSLRTADRFRISAIADGTPAVFVEGPYSTDDSNDLLTDIIVFENGELRNISCGTDEDSSAKRHYSVYSTDIDGNGSLDVPLAEKLSGALEYWIFDWYTYGVDGKSVKCASTYHDYTDGWFFVLPDEWRSTVSVWREGSVSGERRVIFSSVDEDTGALMDRLAVYTLTDENRTERAAIDGRFVLMSSGTVVYAAKIMDGDGAQQDIIDRFRLISSEFNTGAL